MNRPGPIDRERLLLLCQDPVEAYELLEFAIDSLSRIIERMASAIERADSGELKLALHELKGAAGNVGAEELAGLAAIVENGLTTGSQLSALDVPLPEFRAALERLKAVALEFAP